MTDNSFTTNHIRNLCEISDDCNVSYPSYLGDNVCDEWLPAYNTEACCWDGGDCDPPEEQEQFFGDCKVSTGCSVSTLYYWNKLGDGYCNDYYPYNSKECCWDGGDCSRGGGLNKVNKETIVTIVVGVVIFLMFLVSVVFQYRTTRSRANNGSTSTAQPAATTITGAPPSLTEEERKSQRRELILTSIIHKVSHTYPEKLIKIIETCIGCMILI